MMISDAHDTGEALLGSFSWALSFFLRQELYMHYATKKKNTYD
jgi:hypothetical protein